MADLGKSVLLAALVLAASVAVGCGAGQSAASQAARPSGDPRDAPAKYVYETPVPEARTGAERPAPELGGIAGWLNSEPLTLEAQRGKVVLIDFWTYTCVNCIRTLPYLKSWHEKYADKGLVIIGVHTPEFEFEKLRSNVERAVAQYGIRYPVAQDNDFATWDAYNNHFWPAKYLIDRDGVIRFTHFGEGAYDETERKIRELLTEVGSDLTAVPAGTEPGPEADPAARSSDPEFGLTRELYAGHERNFGLLLFRSQPPYMAQEEFFKKRDAEVLYEDPGGHQNHFIYLHGLWRSEAEGIVHARETDEYQDYIAIRFVAASVNAVMAPANGGAFEVRLTMDGRPLRPEQAGADVKFDGAGNSYVMVAEPRMYHLVNLPALEWHDLNLSSNSKEFTLFTFTFSPYRGGEPFHQP